MQYDSSSSDFPQIVDIDLLEKGTDSWSQWILIDVSLDKLEGTEIREERDAEFVDSNKALIVPTRSHQIMLSK